MDSGFASSPLHELKNKDKKCISQDLQIMGSSRMRVETPRPIFNR